MLAVDDGIAGRPRLVRFREITPERVAEFQQQGLRARSFFPHTIYYLPKFGPDGLKMSQRLCGMKDPGASWEVVVYATGRRAAELPTELFFDDDLVWHRQHFGKPFQIATANLVVVGERLYGNNYLSDLVQRISRRREHKTRVESLFRGWASMTLNAILNFALERGLTHVFSPTADCVVSQAPAGRIADRSLFDRVYDSTVVRRYRAERRGRWWMIDVRENRPRIVVPVFREEALADEKTICICHDIEAGYGHVGIDSTRAATASRLAGSALREMLAIEAGARATATYNVLGRLLPEVRDCIAAEGHALAFHSYDHRIRPLWWLTRHGHRLLAAVDRARGVDDSPHQDQLKRCRLLDKRIRGFRPPRSRPSSEWSDEHLARWNFEWLATSRRQLGAAVPIVENRLVKIPIHFDDFPLYKRGLAFAEWKERAIETIETNAFTAFGLHDCYADFWLPYYRELLDALRPLGTLKTLDQVANEVVFAHAA